MGEVFRGVALKLWGRSKAALCDAVDHLQLTQSSTNQHQSPQRVETGTSL
jgi:hypothetical protein